MSRRPSASGQFVEVSKVRHRQLGALIEARLLPVYLTDDGTRVVLRVDLEALPVTWVAVEPPGALPFKSASINSVSESTWTRATLRNGLSALLPPFSTWSSSSGLPPALRALGALAACEGEDVHASPWLGGSYIIGPSRVRRAARNQVERAEALELDTAPELTKAAYYMGSKHSLRSFLVESVASTLPHGGLVVDLMCGAGSATRAFSLNWDVLACDGLEFCTTLASVYSRPARRSIDVTEILSTLHRDYRRNLEKLDTVLGPAIQREVSVLHSTQSDADLRQSYQDYVDAFPKYPDPGSIANWSPTAEVARRKGPANRTTEPFCLVTAYFANVYFGVRQSTELDSIRFAIQHLPDAEDRRIALAALLATASYVSTGYASQFAQPLNLRKLSQKSFIRILERRSIPIFSEFAARLHAFEELQRGARHKVSTLQGPFDTAIDRMAEHCSKYRDVCVYIDAPYTRDEYARYYHVLETLVRYRYPDSTGQGRIPPRGSDDLFRSPFFTRKRTTFAELLAHAIVRSLERASSVVWSYSSRAMSTVPDVVSAVEKQGGFVHASFATNHRYNAQGRSATGEPKVARFVDEYAVVFRRNRDTLVG